MNDRHAKQRRVCIWMALTLCLASLATFGCGDIFGALPCNDSSNCPQSLECVDSVCVEGVECENDGQCDQGQACGADQQCAQVVCEDDEDCPNDGSVCVGTLCTTDEGPSPEGEPAAEPDGTPDGGSVDGGPGCGQTCAGGTECDEVFNACLEGEVFEGDFVVESNADLEDLRGYRRVTGTIFVGFESFEDTTYVNVAEMTAFDLELLVEAKGLWIWQQTTLQFVNLPALRRIGSDGFVASQNTALERISLPVFKGGPVSFFNLEVLESIQMDAVETLGEEEELRILSLPALESVSLSSLQSAHTVSFQWLGTAGGPPAALGLPNLTSFNTMSITDSPTLGRVSLPNLATVDEQLFVGENHGMTTLELPALVDVGDTLTIERHPILTTVEIRSLQTAGNLKVIFNDVLCTEGLFDAVTVDGTVDVTANGACD